MRSRCMLASVFPSPASTEWVIVGADDQVADACPLPVGDLDRGAVPGYPAQVLQVALDPAAQLAAQFMGAHNKQAVLALQRVADVGLRSGFQDLLRRPGPDPPVLGVVGQ